jgi:hypothetical protein
MQDVIIEVDVTPRHVRGVSKPKNEKQEVFGLDWDSNQLRPEYEPGALPYYITRSVNVRKKYVCT